MSSRQSELSTKASNKIEALCEQGCSQINTLLQKAETGSQIDELSDFNNKEVNQIIDELSEIMSIYDVDKKQ